MAAQRAPCPGVAGPIKWALLLQPGSPAACRQSGVVKCVCALAASALFFALLLELLLRAFALYRQGGFSFCIQTPLMPDSNCLYSRSLPHRSHLIQIPNVRFYVLISAVIGTALALHLRLRARLRVAQPKLGKSNGAVQMCMCHPALPCHLHRPPRLSHSTCDRYSQRARCGQHSVACRGWLHQPHERKQDACPVSDPRHLPHSSATRDSGRQPPCLHLLFRYGRCRSGWQQH